MKVAGIGEVLFDCFPDGSRMGGTSANACAMLGQLGLETALVTAVGADELGQRAKDELTALGVTVEYVQTVNDKATGRVLVQVAEDGQPSYQIEEDVAWDFIRCGEKESALAGTLDAVCFGTLSCRAGSLEAVRRFVQGTGTSCWRLFDVNLRSPFYTADWIREGVSLANVIKFNDEELPVIAEALGETCETVVPALLSKHGMELVVLTCGDEGAVMWTPERRYSFPAAVLERVVDTVGAGDSFTAVVMEGLVRGRSIEEIGRRAVAVAGYVCGCRGATPTLPDELK